MGHSPVLTPHLVVYSTEGISHMQGMHSSGKAWTGWLGWPKTGGKWNGRDSPAAWEMHFSLVGVFTSLCFISGLLWESGGVAGWQQAPAGNHRHGHLGSAGKRLSDKLLFHSSFLRASLPVSLINVFCVGAFVCVYLSVCLPWPLYLHLLLRES